MLLVLLLAFLLPVPLAAAPAPAPQPAGAISATIRIGFAKIDVPAGATGPYAAFGPLIAQMLTPEGPATIQYTVSADAMRAELDGRLGPLPRGTVVLQRLGEPTMRVLTPAQKTWYEIPAGQSLGMMLGAPDIEIQPTGEHATIAGQPADRFRFTETLQVPTPDGANVPADFPREIHFTGDLWSTTALAGSGYAAIMQTMQTFAAVPGIEALTAGGRFPLRMSFRSDLLAGYELQTEVTALHTAPVDPGRFVVPSDYQKVQPPFGGGGAW
jgi:hypothetical protein